MKNLKKYFNTVQFKTLGIFVIGLIILFGGMFVWVTFRSEPAPVYFAEYLAAIALLCVAISSVFVIKYKEVPRPGLQSIKGTWAVIQGAIALLISGLGFIILVYDATVNLLK
jgi:hypothetical protein